LVGHRRGEDVVLSFKLSCGDRQSLFPTRIVMLDQPLSRVESPGPGCSEEQRTSHEVESEDQPVDRAHLQVSEYSRTAVGTIGSGGDGYAHLIDRPDSGDNRRNQDWNPSAEALEARVCLQRRGNVGR
jgi:hypothetical protein